MANHHLGIDIRLDGINAVKLNSRLKSTAVVGQWSIDFPQGGYSPEHLDEALSALAEKTHLAGCESAISLPAAWGYLRQISLPFREKKKIEQVLGYELEPLLPVSADSILVDYQITGEIEDGSTLLAAAADRALLASVIASFNRHKLNPNILTFNGCASAELLQQRLTPEEDAVLVCPATGHTCVFLVSGRQVRQMRSLHKDLRSLPPDEAAALIQRAVYAFSDGKTDIAFSPQRVYLEETAAAPDTLCASLSEILGLPVEWFRPGRTAAVDPGKDRRTTPSAPTFAGALALAWSSVKGARLINFRKGPFAVGKFWQEHRKALIAPALIALLIMGVAGYRSLVSIRYDQSRLDDIDQRITRTFREALPDVNRIVNPVLQMRTKLEELKRESPQFVQAGGSPRAIDLLRAISAAIPPELSVVLSQVVISPESILLSGDTDTFNTVNSIQQRLEKEPTFTSVSISSANQQKSGNRINFKIRIQL